MLLLLLLLLLLASTPKSKHSQLATSTCRSTFISKRNRSLFRLSIPISSSTTHRLGSHGIYYCIALTLKQALSTRDSTAPNHKDGKLTHSQHPQTHHLRHSNR